MSYDLVFLVEERSMQVMLGSLLPRFLPQEVSFKCIPHEGKSDLEKSLFHKLKGWRTLKQPKFIILRDQDSGDCRQIKQGLLKLCRETNKEVLIRIVCHELESWYLGDLLAVEKAFDKKLTQNQNSKKFRDPDRLESPSKELKKLIPTYQKMRDSKKIGLCLDINNNTSKSFQAFIKGVQSLIKQP